MGCYVLQAQGNDAKERPGGPDLVLWMDKAILLGRAVKEAEGYKYPNDWNSLSSRHCTLKYENVGHSTAWWCRPVQQRSVAWSVPCLSQCQLMHVTDAYQALRKTVAATNAALVNPGGQCSHCHCFCMQGHFLVTDLSTNGTFVNNNKIGKGNTRELSVGDTFGLSLVPPTAVQANLAFRHTVE